MFRGEVMVGVIGIRERSKLFLLWLRKKKKINAQNGVTIHELTMPFLFAQVIKGSGVKT